MGNLLQSVRHTLSLAGSCTAVCWLAMIWSLLLCRDGKGSSYDDEAGGLDFSQVQVKGATLLWMLPQC
jgi:hypothetical protein